MIPDVTGAEIVLGLVLCAGYLLACGWRRKSPTFGAIWAISACGVAVPIGIGLIKAALANDPTHLPSDWRYYVAAAGAVCIGLGVKYTLDLFSSALAKPHAATPIRDDSQGEPPPQERP